MSNTNNKPTTSYEWRIALLIAFTIIGVVLTGVMGNYLVSNSRVDGVVRCVEAGGDPLECRHGVGSVRSR